MSPDREKKIREIADRAATSILSLTGDDIPSRASCIAEMHIKQAMTEAGSGTGALVSAVREEKGLGLMDAADYIRKIDERRLRAALAVLSAKIGLITGRETPEVIATVIPSSVKVADALLRELAK